MQKPDNNLTPLTLIAVPTDLLEEVGLDEFSTVQIYTSQGQLIMEPVDEEEAGLSPMGHDPLEAFLESLTPQKQYEAMSFLSALWAERENANQTRCMGGRK